MCNQPWDNSSTEKVTLASRCRFCGPGAKNRKLDLWYGVHLHLILDSASPGSTPSHHQCSKKACLQPVPPELEDGRWTGKVSDISKRIGPTLCSKKEPEKTQRSDWASDATALSSTSVVELWHQVETQRKLGNIAVQRQPCRHRGKKITPWGFPFSLRLLPHFVFLFGNKWNCKVSRCFATVAQSHSPPPRATHTPPHIHNLQTNPAAPSLPARAPVFPQVTLALKLLLCRKLKNHLASLLKQCVFLLCFQKALGDSMFVFSLLAPGSPM